MLKVGTCLDAIMAYFMRVFRLVACDEGTISAKP